MLALGQLQEDPAPGKQGEREPLLQRSEAVAALLQGTAEFHPVRLPLATHRIDVVHLDSDVLDTLAELHDEVVNLRSHGLVVALHERDLRVPALHDHGIHAREFAPHIPCGPDHVEPQDLRKQVLSRSQILDAQGDVIDSHRAFHGRCLLYTRPPQASSHPPAPSLPRQAPVPVDAPLPVLTHPPRASSHPPAPSLPRPAPVPVDAPRLLTHPPPAPPGAAPPRTL